MTKLRNLLLILLVLFGGIFSAQVASAKSVDIEVSNTNLTPEVVEGGNSTRFSFDFTVPNGTKKDDTTTISLPKELDFQRYQEFEVYAPDGQAVAKAVIEPKSKTLTMTYTDYVEKHSDIKGHLEMNVVVDRKVVTTANTVAAEITINNKTKITIGTGKLSYTGTKGDSDKIDFWKYGVSSNNNEIVYLININTSKSTVPDVTISDQLKSPGLQYVEDSFEIQEGNWYKNEWNYWALGSEINVTSKYKDKIEISSDKTSFKVKLGDINGKGYRIKYRVKAAYTLINGEKLNNLAEYYTGTTRRSHASHVQTYQGASGSASGYNYGLIIEKVNEERQLLAGAEFTVTRTATGQVIGKFMTDEKGIVEVTGLLRDEYTITETKAPAGYAIAAPVTRIADNSIVTIIDKKANTDIEGKKTWVDNNDQDGKRPKSIKVNLLANGTIVQTKEVTAENDWSYKFSGLDQHDKDGEKIVYTVSEEKVDGYEMKVEGTNITNTHTPETTQVSGTKTWNDNNDQDGKRPKSITVNLLADGKVIKSQQVTAENDWKYTFTDLPKYANGKEIVYTVEEVKVDGYETKVEGTNITNTHTPETTQVSGTKTWNDNNDQDGKRPQSITVNLLADGKPFKTQKVTAENNWKYTFTDLPKYANGKEIVYTVEEVKVDGYETKVEGINITNTHTPETTQVSGTKTWNDNNDQDGKRPQSITVNLLADGKVIKSQQVTAENDWKYTFTDLPKYANGKEIVYTVTENAVEGYTTTYDKYNITNSYTPGQTSLTVTKAWDDKDNQDGKRPEAIQVQLYANGEKLGEPVTLTADNKWTHTWTGLAKKANKKDIVYTVKEVSKVEGYTTTVGTVENGNVTITNTYKPSTTSIKVNKVWKDNNNQDGLRPTSITVNLLADGEIVKTETITPNADGDWSHTFTDLPEYKNGKKITYTVSEEKVEGYETKVEGTTITNTHTPETTEVAGTKTWNDNNDQDGKRPKSITVNLLADGQPVASKIVTADDNWAYKFSNLPAKKNGAAITYTISEKAVADYTTTYDGYNITNSYTPGETSVTATKVWEDNNNQDGLRREIKLELYADGVATGQVQTLSEENNWKATWTGLAKKANKKDIVYTVKEVTAIDGYTSKVTQTSTNNFTITNTHTPETTQVSGTKTWNDNNDQDGKRPKSITVNLLANGEVVQSQKVSADTNWTYTFTNLPKYANGKEIIYTVSEEKVEGYETTVEGTNITNTHTPETTQVSGAKTWNDNNDQDGKRPKSITVNLLADGKVIKSQQVTAENDWKYTFTDLPKYANGKEIVYTVSEEKVDGYEMKVDGYNITNSYTPSTTSVKVNKVWKDKDNQDGLRPTSIIVNLLADGQVVSTTTIKPDANGDWNYTFTDLPEYKNGKKITYTVEEANTPNGYTSSVEGTTITNTHTPETTEIAGTKTWNDNNDQDGKRPKSITVNLLANGEVVQSQKVSTDTNWTYTFTNLPKYANGKEIVYTVTENAVDNYTTTIDGHNITNSYTPGQTSLTVTKVWKDNNNQDGKRPGSIQVQLYANGEKLGEPVTLTADNKWTHTWTGLAKKANQKDIVYTVKEVSVVDGYTASVGKVENGNVTITNTYKPTTPPKKKKSTPLPSTGSLSGLGLTFVGLALAATISAQAIYRKRK